MFSCTDKPLWKKAFDLFCGLEDTNGLTEEQQEQMQASLMDISEEKWPAVAVNIAAVAMLAAGVFLFAFYA